MAGLRQSNPTELTFNGVKKLKFTLAEKRIIHVIEKYSGNVADTHFHKSAGGYFYCLSDTSKGILAKCCEISKPSTRNYFIVVSYDVKKDGSFRSNPLESYQVELWDIPNTKKLQLNTVRGSSDFDSVDFTVECTDDSKQALIIQKSMDPCVLNKPEFKSIKEKILLEAKKIHDDFVANTGIKMFTEAACEKILAECGSEGGVFTASDDSQRTRKVSDTPKVYVATEPVVAPVNQDLTKSSMEKLDELFDDDDL